ncbi:MAG TPA: cytochrome c1 [Stellaceae bacterium]|nr:cytochrome c1 [Stellaceae bacterium]
MTLVPMSRVLLAAAGLACLLLCAAAVPSHAQETPPLPHQEWSFDGVFGTYDKAALQRGFQVYKQICSACHPVKHLYFRDLEALGYTPDQVKAIAVSYQVTDGPNDQGQMYQRPGRPSDPIPGPFPNDEAARAANGGALPPDLSMIVKARDGGPDYVYALMNGFKNPPPAGFSLAPGKYYNEYFPGHQISMPPPLSDGAVTFADGTKSTVPQMAHDVATFLNWASEPNLDTRHRVGARVFLFLIVGVGIFYAAKRKIWSSAH